MSAGPIKQARDAWRPPVVSTSDSARLCAAHDRRSYCGRRGAPLTPRWKDVTCADCQAARRADEGAAHA